MTILLTGDIHLSENPRDAYRFEFIDWLKKTIRRKQISDLILLGDLTDTKDFHSAWLTNAVADYIRELADQCPVTILMGNHDYLSSADNPFFQFLQYMPRVQWIGKPTYITKFDAFFLPHTRNYKKDWAGQRFEEGFVFAHNTFAGSKVRDQELDGISTNVFSDKVQVWSGDVHVPQKVGKNINYVGAPYTINFGDTYQGRVVLLEGDEVVSLNYNGPQKRLIEVPGIASLSKYTQRANEGDLIRVRIKLDQKDQGRWEGIRTSIKKWAEENKLVLDSIQPIFEHRIVRSYKKVDARSDAELMETFAKRASVPPRTLKTGLKFL